MEFNRTPLLLAGLVVLLLGIQLRLVDSYVLTRTSPGSLWKRQSDSECGPK